MRRLIAGRVKAQMCVTSPPYYGLRDYGHEGQLGLEATPDEYVANLVEVFRLVRELLADAGTLWLNLGDSYAGSWGAQGGQGKTGVLAGRTVSATRQIAAAAKRASGTGSLSRCEGLKPKDLIGIPWRVAFALQADGWFLRQDIIWHKPNPMPESVKDRCTKAHEYLFLLSKSARYYFDHAAIAEPATRPEGPGNSRPYAVTGARQGENGNIHDSLYKIGPRNTRARRDVWTVPTQPYGGAHFAVFPPSLIEPCVLAGSRSGDVVLDPFFGSGTTGLVAEALGRRWIGCEINQDYANLQRERTAQIGMEL